MYTPEEIFKNELIDLAYEEYAREEAYFIATNRVGASHRQAAEMLIFMKRDVKNELINILTDEYLDLDYFNEASTRLEAIEEYLDIAKGRM